jgi:pyridoxal phosphate-dependent aminotransferase EpsN
MDPVCLAQAIESLDSEGLCPKAAIVVDLYGQSADWDRLLPIFEAAGISVVEDAAEALGAEYAGKSVGGFGKFGVFSFNGNKILTTSGGGMLVSDDSQAVKRARHLASQAREDAPHYEHREVGYNYRLSSILAAVGRSQLRVLRERVAARRQVSEWYREEIGDQNGIEFMPEAEYGRASRWLTCVTVEPDLFGAGREDIRIALESENIEARPVWKPMHLQKVFEGCRFFGPGVSARLFSNGLCLPSGSALTQEQVKRISGIVRDSRGR